MGGVGSGARLQHNRRKASGHSVGGGLKQEGLSVEWSGVEWEGSGWSGR
jgi:hypothetical protein